MLKKFQKNYPLLAAEKILDEIDDILDDKAKVYRSRSFKSLLC